MSVEKVNANPTKDFFISMLVKDISLINAIADLVDNCVDGAIKIRKNGDYTGLRVDLTLSSKSFEITDNCGGFSSEVAAKYAFRFGRTELAENKVDNSVGRFGVGMKRALFKIGKNFTVKSVCSSSEFSISVDVNEWKQDESNDWQFKFDYINGNPTTDNFGTKITMYNIYEDIAKQFEQSTFINTLKKEIKASHEKMLEKGLIISINGQDLEFNPSYLLISDEIKPAYCTFEIEGGISIKIYAGITDRGKPKEAGWYIYCNQRLILEADRTLVTGWGDGFPLFHNSFARFRGYVFIDAKDADILPWNTTKSGIDQDSLIYRGIRLEMIKIGRTVIDFLKDLVKENQEEDDDEILNDFSLNDKIDVAKNERISFLKTDELAPKFTAPQLVRIRKPNDTQKIQYVKPISEILKVKSVLKVTTLKEVGEKTFDYFYRMECDD
ncbi:MAG: ATP-binding protein [Anaerobacillus sp.]|uniref:ATP-binding protein n=1 Tax=Anaerobacillus sp. TaxID=1872506 RepID=UPI0039192CCB